MLYGITLTDLGTAIYLRGSLSYSILPSASQGQHLHFPIKYLRLISTDQRNWCFFLLVPSRPWIASRWLVNGIKEICSEGDIRRTGNSEQGESARIETFWFLPWLRARSHCLIYMTANWIVPSALYWWDDYTTEWRFTYYHNIETKYRMRFGKTYWLTWWKDLLKAGNVITLWN